MLIGTRRYPVVSGLDPMGKRSIEAGNPETQRDGAWAAPFHS
jgi:hypothetical protein